MRIYGRRCVLALLAVVAASAATWVPPAVADTTVHVNTTADDSTPGNRLCSLREAVNYAIGAAEADCSPGTATGTTTIVLPAGCFRLISALSFSGSDTTVIQGAGAGAADCGQGGSVIVQQSADEVIGLEPNVDLTMTGVTVTGGHPDCACPGGGIANLGGSLTLAGVVVTGNAAFSEPDAQPFSHADGAAGADGGGIYNTGTLEVEGSTISGNSAGAGGAGAENESGTRGGAGGRGGGIYNSSGDVTVIDSTISGNRAGGGGDGGLGDTGAGGNGGAGGPGGGIYNGTGTVTLENATLAGNAAGPAGSGGLGVGGNGSSGNAGAGGGVFSTSSVTMVNTTIAGNAAPGGGGGIDGHPTEVASVVASNSTPNCQGGVNDGGANVVFGDASCAGVEADPRLGPLASNGGPVQTMALGAGSAALDLESPGLGCPAADARGIARPQGPKCDAGAYEVVQVPTTSAGGTTAGPGLTFTAPPAGGGGGGAGGVLAPQLTRLRESARRWIEGRGPAAIAAKGRLSTGTTFSFTLNAPATVTFSFIRLVRGRRTRAVRAGTLTFSAQAGNRRVRFAGRISSGHGLKPGVYTLSVVASNAAGRSGPRRLKFTILR